MSGPPPDGEGLTRPRLTRPSMSGEPRPWSPPTAVPRSRAGRERSSHRLLAAMMDACPDVSFEPIRDAHGVLGWVATGREDAGSLVILPRGEGG